MKAATFRRLINLWPPLLFAGIRADHISDDFRQVDVSLTLRWFNRNINGAHYGGSLFSMTDPWYGLMLLNVLGERDYLVWTKSASIDYLNPGHGVVTARFALQDDDITAVRDHLSREEKMLRPFDIDILDRAGTVVARVTNTVYIRRRTPLPATAPADRPDHTAATARPAAGPRSATG